MTAYDRYTSKPSGHTEMAVLPLSRCTRCGRRCFQYTRTLDQVHCHRCVDDLRLMAASAGATTLGLTPVVIVNRIIGADRSLCDMAAPWEQMTQSLQRGASVSYPQWTDSTNAVRCAWGFNVPVDQAAVFEYAYYSRPPGQTIRKLYAALPTRDGSCWVVQLGNERSSAYAVRQWASGLITTQELISGVDRLPDA